MVAVVVVGLGDRLETGGVGDEPQLASVIAVTAATIVPSVRALGVPNFRGFEGFEGSEGVLGDISIVVHTTTFRASGHHPATIGWANAKHRRPQRGSLSGPNQGLRSCSAPA